jgi:hypothetical protein
VTAAEVKVVYIYIVVVFSLYDRSSPNPKRCCYICLVSLRVRN